ncbi:MAG TPA: GTPase ObgE [Planctomycetota bacterium]|nr:GTPase ObgE [Planctomycetota bacterium]
MFIDEAEIEVEAGRGGDGCVSFRREKHVPRGGPNGGDGGRGGSIFLRADEQIGTLLDMTQRARYVAESGRAGSGKRHTGKSGEDVIIRVPVGTIVRDADRGNVLRDLDTPGQEICVARGGRGGHGNKFFATATEQTPRHAEEGEPGQRRRLHLELKLIADVGLVGLPNAGKSTLLSRLSKAHPKIADYPFTTLTPQLGIVEGPGQERFVMADIPGLIEGAHQGVGLGDAFLRHIERTRLIVHIVDVAPIEGAPAVVEAYRVIRNELAAYSRNLAARPEVVVANKLDLTGAAQGVKLLRETVDKDVCAISAAVGTGLKELLRRILHALKELRQADPHG